MEQPQVIRAGALREGQVTPGMIRSEAFAGDGVWIGEARTEPGVASGWHHHGTHQSYLYVVSGRLLVETDSSADPADAYEGDFMWIPAGVVHRESNPSDVVQHIIVTRVGDGPVVVNVDGPQG